ncbi:hypothetical protein GW924_04230 [Candidatus Pacearchaeota archaeon]|nr:hypothetical protein [Candidatus Pacearchaeota archaeon]OIO43848.1 MAG: hypothetical protein AUJ64_01620 [Candidatus Pacearchaeota archaeon CG1_02_39_14]
MLRGLGKKGLSPVVATVLIIMITVVAVTLIAAFIVPFVQKVPEEGQRCFEVFADLSFHDTLYNCYSNDTQQQTHTGFSVSINDESIQGFTLLAINKGQSERYTITDGISGIQELKMLGGTWGEALEVPDNGGVRTYVYKGHVESFEIYPVLADGKQCEKSDQIEPRLCASTEVANCVNGEGSC